jgi:hypothetical protein
MALLGVLKELPSPEHAKVTQAFWHIYLRCLAGHQILQNAAHISLLTVTQHTKYVKYWAIVLYTVVRLQDTLLFGREWKEIEGDSKKYFQRLFTHGPWILVHHGQVGKWAHWLVKSKLQVKVKVASRGFFNTPASLAGLLYSCPNKFPHSSPEAPRIIQMRETSTSEVLELLMMGGETARNMQSIDSNKEYCITLHLVGCT